MAEFLLCSRCKQYRPGRNSDMCVSCVASLNAPRGLMRNPRPNVWTAQEHQRLRELWAKYPHLPFGKRARRVSRFFPGRTIVAVERKAYKLGLVERTRGRGRHS